MRSQPGFQGRLSDDGRSKGIRRGRSEPRHSSLRFFCPSVSGAATLSGSAKVGVKPNQAFGFMDTQPKHVGFTLNSDTPYDAMLLDLRIGPVVVELPPGH
jgi:hypothetical protein